MRSFTPNLEIWIQDSGAAGHVSLAIYFSNFWRIKLKGLDPQPDSAIQSKVHGLLHRVCEFITHYIKKDIWKTTRKHSKCLQKYSTPAVIDYEELGGLSDPG